MNETRFEVPAELDGERADKIVAVLASLSRADARRLIDEGLVTVRGEPVAPKARLQSGNEIDVVISPRIGLVPEDLPLVVRYEDDHLLVVDKAAGMVVHPGAGQWTGTLAAGVLARWPQVAGVGQRDRWGIVHRLDRDVSGLLAVALTARAYEGLVQALANRRVIRDYRALAHGSFDATTGTIDAPIGRDPRHPARMRVLPEGRPSRTHYRRTAYWSRFDVSALDVSLETGRTHQIRVHLASIDHPIVGDRTYGHSGPPDLDPGRVWLHAARLEFDHPVTAERVSIESPLPPVLQLSLEVLGPPDAAIVRH
jgi:23S rRNA pseudouridine1911/1915/1917 synthase